MVGLTFLGIWFFLGKTRKTRKTRKEKRLMITMEEAVENGMIPFVDERIKCTDCAGYNPRPWGGKCHKGKIQYPKILNRCNMYAQKVLQTTEVFWETSEEKPFWEI